MPNDYSNIWIVIDSSLICSLITGLFVHRLTRSRDAESRIAILAKEADVRRRTFLKFSHCFRGRMERIDHNDNDAVWRGYTALAPEFKGEVALVGSDFADPATFAKLADTVGGWPYEEVQRRAKKENTNMREVICDSIDRIIEFTEKQAQPIANSRRL